MWNIEVLSFVGGFILLFIALIGGGFKIKEIEMPTVASKIRFISALFGIVLIIVGFNLNSKEKSTDNETNKIAEPIQQEAACCSECKVWNILWICQGVQYEGLLVYNPEKGFGKMRVKYFDGNKNIMIQENMKQTTTQDGQYLAGENPFNTETFQPTVGYVPDNLIMNNEIVQAFDSRARYETKMLVINDVEAIIRVYGFTCKDLNY